VITLEIEPAGSGNLSYSQLERVAVVLNLGGPVDVEILKQGESEMDESSSTLTWYVSNLHETGSSVFSFASSKLNFDDLFPIEVKFEETYSLIDMRAAEVV